MTRAGGLVGVVQGKVAQGTQVWCGTEQVEASTLLFDELPRLRQVQTIRPLN